MSSTNLLSLPEECLSYILSLTSPRDVGRSSVVSKQLLMVSESNTIWEKFLPSHSELMTVSQTSTSLGQHFTSKKNLFFHLCRCPTYFNNNTMSFALDIRSGKKCYMLSVRACAKISGRKGTPEFGTWKISHRCQSRFPEMAKLLAIILKGKIHTSMLSPNTIYGVYFLFKITRHPAIGEYITANVSVLEVDEGLPRNDHHLRHNLVLKYFYLKPRLEFEDLKIMEHYGMPVEHPVERRDGWMEIEMGRHQVGVDSVANESMVLEMCLREINALNRRASLLVQGFELRPLE